MNTKFTLTLTTSVLTSLNKPVAKVRLAKFIYFAFKELVKSSYLHYDDLKFVRMPLGPVPYDFTNQLKNPTFQLTLADIGLTYNRESYSVKNISSSVNTFDKFLYSKILQYDKYPTSYLIEKSHQDPSWMSHLNGEEYFISKHDLLNNFLGGNAEYLLPEFDDQMIQAKLLSGMENEIIKDNSAMEYPDAYKE